MLYPSNFENKIDFVTVRALLKDKCISSLGKERVDEVRFSSDYEEVNLWISQTDEMLRLMTQSDEVPPVGDFYDIRQAMSRIRVEGLFLDEVELFDLKRALDAVRRMVDFITKQDPQHFPELNRLLDGVSLFPDVIRQIDRILDKFGKIKDNASTELARIRKDLIQAQSSVSRTLQNILRQAQADGYVEKDVAPTVREGRLVIPVSPAFKRKVNGIVHDESASGKTVFIEPAQVVESNNRIRELEGEERREIIRILVEFTDFIRPHTEEIIQSQFFLGEIDFLRAKALFAEQINALKPRLEDVCQLEWNKAVHPLLFLSLQRQGKSIVPLNILLNNKQRILLISGPNAGGKSVCLKTVALLQYMLQCGLLIPLHDSSSCGIFERLFIDIGDEQSIENDLSTYSSHLLNMKHFIRNSNNKTLILIDEFGTGTEPMIGGAIAEATLERYNRSEAFGVITTHYTNLKHYAEATDGIVNGAMLYDRQHLQPLFQLQIGNPGSSFAVEIARKIGLPEDLIKDASDKVGAEHLDYDKHLQDIVRDKRYWENKRQQIRMKEKKLDELLSNYENEMSTLDKQRKEITQTAKKEAQQMLSDANARIENTIREIKEAQAEKEKTREIRKNLNEFKEQVESTKTETYKPKLKKKKPEKPQQQVSKPQPENLPITIGSNVKVEGQQVIGKVLEIKDKMAVVAFGQLKSTVKLKQLTAVSNNQIKKEVKKWEHLGQSSTDDVRKTKLHFTSELDIRGYRGDEALQTVMYYIDEAIMVGVASVRILHGTGTGALRQLVRQYLGTVHGVKKFRDEHIQMGGAGITVVEFDD